MIVTVVRSKQLQNNIAAAKLAGILTDLNLHGVQFQVRPIKTQGMALSTDFMLDLREYPLCGIPVDASPLESSPQQARKAESLLAHMHGGMGSDFGAHGCMPKLWRPHCLPFYARFR